MNILVTIDSATKGGAEKASKILAKENARPERDYFFTHPSGRKDKLARKFLYIPGLRLADRVFSLYLKKGQI